MLILPVWARASAGAAPIPIDGPMTITESGDYIVTKDIWVEIAPAITIDAPEVFLDLDGKTVGTRSFREGEVVLMGERARLVRIANGILSGGERCFAGGAEAITIDRVSCIDGFGGVAIAPRRSLTVVNSHFAPSAWGFAARGVFSLLFVGNVVRQGRDPSYYWCGTSFDGVTEGLVAGNIFQCDAYQGYMFSVRRAGFLRIHANQFIGSDQDGGITLDGDRFAFVNNDVTGCGAGEEIGFGGNGGSIVNNRIRSRLAVCTAISAGGSDNRILDNVIEGYVRGMGIGGSRNRIEGNAVTASYLYDDGFRISGKHNLILDNRARGARRGMLLGGSENVYRNNDFRGNRVAIEDVGEDNIDAGGNLQ